MQKLRVFSTVLCLAATCAGAEVPETDGIAVAGRLSDAEFYRLATCGASPGGDCKVQAWRWAKRNLTVAVAMGDTRVPSGFENRLAMALTNALAEINGAGAGIRLVLANATTADILIRPTRLAEGTILTEKPGFSAAGVMGSGYMSVWADSNNHITEAVILISTEVAQDDLTSIMLEEVTQSLGFTFDVEGSAYEGVSILSQTSNDTETIAGQDAVLLRLHYPPNP